MNFGGQSIECFFPCAKVFFQCVSINHTDHSCASPFLWNSYPKLSLKLEADFPYPAKSIPVKDS